MKRYRHDQATIRNLEALGQAFREARKGAGLTQQALAERAGVHVATIKRIESGRVDPAYGRMFALAREIGVPLASIFVSARGLPDRTNRPA